MYISVVRFNGALPIQVGKQVTQKDTPAPTALSFNGALPIQVGKPLISRGGAQLLRVLHWSPTHSGRETRVIIAERYLLKDASMEPYPFR